jgi:hypothetical protein
MQPSPKKITRTKHRYYRFFSGPVHDGQFHAACLDVHDAARGFPLGEDWFASPKIRNSSRYPCGIEKQLRVEDAALSIFVEFLRFRSQRGAPTLNGLCTDPTFLPSRLLQKCTKVNSQLFS